jgi:hypothetical protein
MNNSPLDISRLASLLGMKDLEIIQLQHQNMLVNAKLAELQAAFDAAVDARDMPSGATTPPDEFAGS